MAEKKLKKWWRYLLNIPLVLLVDVVLFAIGAILDSQMWVNTDKQGHGFPVFIVLFTFLAFIITIIVIARSITKAIQSARAPKEEDIDPANVDPGFTHVSPLGYVIACGIEILFSIGAVVLVGRWEISSFYQDPNHIGFPIPITTMFLAFFLFLFTVIFVVICTLLYRRRKKKAQQQA